MPRTRPRPPAAWFPMPFRSRLRFRVGAVRPLVALALVATLAGCETFRQPASAPPPRPQAAPAVRPGPLPPLGPTRAKVGLLLPLSGANKALGEAMMSAAELALFDVGEANLELLPRDTGDTPDGARAAAASALADGAEALVGPFGAPAVRAVAPLAAARAAPVVAFSTDRAVAGRGVYLMGFMPDEQVTRIVGYATAQGLRRHAAIAPNNAYGNTVLAAWRAALARAGAEAARVERSEENGPNVEPMRRLADGGAPFDALLMPEGGVRLRQLAPLLGYFEVDTTRVRLLGTAQWDEPGLGRVPQLVGAWFAGPPPQAWEHFSRRWQDAYAQNQPPMRFAALAYDAVALAATQARLPYDIRFRPDAIANPAGFAGANGIFRFRPDGIPEHALAIMQVTPEGPLVVDPAAESFAGPTQ